MILTRFYMSLMTDYLIYLESDKKLDSFTTFMKVVTDKGFNIYWVYKFKLLN